MIKIWHGYGSEHSANLVMIGRFATMEDAEAAEKDFLRLREVISKEFDFDKFDEDERSAFSQTIRDVLSEMKIYSFSPADVYHFALEHHFERRGKELEISTDELDINGFVKFLIDNSASVQIYSAHDFPNGPDKENS